MPLPLSFRKHSPCPCLYTGLAALAAALLLLFTAAPESHARPEMAGGSHAETRFKAMDADKDGKVTREEFFAAHPQMKEGAFQAIDTNKDDAISLEEWQTFAAGHKSADPHGEKGGMGGMMPPKGMQSSNATDGGGAKGPMPGLIMPPDGK